MLNELRFYARSFVYDISKGLLARPLAITGAYASSAVAMVFVEQRFPEITTLASRVARITHEDVAASQLILATIAGSMMTTVSVVFSVLVMALSLASLQFSPRILRGFIGDRATQSTLGIFVGTFVYSLLVLRTVRGEPDAFVPAASVTVAMLLAAGAMAWLIYFMHHIAEGINASHIAERVANETIEIIDEEFPIAVGRADTHPEDVGPPACSPDTALTVEAVSSGYVQLVNRESLLALAREHGVTIYQEHGISEFVTEGNPLVSVAPPDKVTDELREACVECFELGAERTMQQDVQYGIRQIVDMALKAISPAVNDPTTATTCIDQLGRVLCHLARRRILPLEMRDEASGALLMVRRAVTFHGSLDLAFHQLRQYGRGDMAVCLRLIRALTEIATCTDHPPHLERVLHHARLVESGLSEQFPSDDRQALAQRVRDLTRRIAGRTASTTAC